MLSIQIVDHGRWRSSGLHAAGTGPGLDLMQRFADAVMIHHNAHGTRVLMRHLLPATARPLPDPGVPTGPP